MTTRTHPEAVQRWVELLRQAVERAGKTDTAVRTRGAGDPIEGILSKLIQEPSDVRRKVIEALGDQGEQLALEVLGRLAAKEAERPLRLMIVSTLAKVGAREGIDILMDMARNDLSEDVRAEAIRQLGNMALASWPALAQRTRGVSRVRGAIRVRGVTPSKSVGLSPQAEAILSLLDQIRFRDPSTLVRGVADETLGRLDE